MVSIASGSLAIRVKSSAYNRWFDEAERASDVDKLAFCVRLLIVQAASSRAVGMSA
jgi:hypothetical protein